MKSAAWIAAPAIALLALAGTPASVRAMRAPQSIGEKTKDGAETVKDAVVKGVTVAADKTKQGLSKTGEVMTDEWITGRVHARFVDEELLKGSNISVDTTKHIVTLTGTVTARSGRTRATTVAKGTEGVHRVINRLTIGPKV